jgi:DNA primase catalytic core
MLDNIVNSCRYLLENYPDAQHCKDYLDSRLSKDAQEKFQFGYFPSIQHMAALAPLVDEKELREDKLLYSKEIEDAWCSRTLNFLFFENHPLVMPYKDAYGDIVGIVGRSLLSDDERKVKKISKYKNTDFISKSLGKFKKGNFLYGLYENKKHILEKDGVFIVEGQFDVIKAVENGFNNIVALGNSNMSIYQFSLISRYTNNIFLLLDKDEAGEKGRKRILSKFGQLANIHNFYLPEGYKDIDEYLSSNSYESLTFSVKS